MSPLPEVVKSLADLKRRLAGIFAEAAAWKPPQLPWWLLCLASGILLALAFPKAGLFPLVLFALWPFLHFLLDRPPYRRVLVGHFLFTSAFFIILLYWIPEVLVVFGNLPYWAAVLAFLALLALLGALMLPATLLTRWTASHSLSAAVWCAPGFWVLNEMFRNYFVGGGFPWGLAGYALQPFPYLSQAADLSGVFGLSLVAVAVNAALASGVRGSAPRFQRAALALFLVLTAYGAYRVHFWAPRQGEAIRAGLVQPAIALAEGREHYAEKYFETLPAFYQEAAKAGVDWVIFSEAQNPYFFGRDFYYTTFWQRQVRTYGVPLLFNSTFAAPGQPGALYNSAHLLDARGEAVYRYDKVKLVPFGEFLPWQPVMEYFFQPLVREVSGFAAGRKMTLGQLPQARFATLICFESIFPQLARGASGRGAGVLVNITNDSWYGDSSAPYQLLQMARIRSVEARRPLLRSANTGITASIDPWGGVLDRLAMFKQGWLLAEVRPVEYLSIYARIGESLNIAVALASLAAAIGARLARGPLWRKGSV